MTSITRFTAVVLLLAIHATVFAEDAIRWAPDLETARAAATRNKQLIYIHFYGDNCPPCRRLEANVFSQASFAQSLEANYVPVKINASQQTEIAKQFGVDRWPQDVIITPEGQFVYRTISPQDESRYVSMLTMVSQKANPQAAAAPEMVAQAGSPTVTASMQVPVSQPALPQPNQEQRGSVYSSFTANNAPAPQQPAMQQPAPQQVAPQLPPPPASRFANAGPAPAATPAAASAPMQSRFSSGPVASQTTPSMPGPPAVGGPDPQPEANQVAQQSAPQQPVPGPPAAQQPQAAPAAQPKFAMDGYCPVTLMEGMKWQKGDPRWGAQHQGQIYLFSSQVEQQKFLANPNQYSPVMSGIDPVAYLSKGKTVPGDRRFGLTYRGTLYLFSSEESLQTFWNDPTRYSSMVQQAMAAQNMHR